jgi:hypothetical protein
MHIFESFEVRWFFAEGVGIEGALSWFQNVEPEPAHSDDYLLTGRMPR